MDNKSVVDSFRASGFADCGTVIDEQWSRDLFAKLEWKRYFGPDIFFTEQEFEESLKNPPAGRGKVLDLLEGEDVSPIEDSPELKEAFSKVLGPNCRIYARRVICSVPLEWVPAWVFKKYYASRSASFNLFIKPEFHDVRHFLGINYHQDTMDFVNRDPDFVTFYVYLQDVDENNSPLFVFPKSHA
jgi:hypothetical protein